MSAENSLSVWTVVVAIYNNIMGSNKLQGLKLIFISLNLFYIYIIS